MKKIIFGLWITSSLVGMPLGNPSDPLLLQEGVFWKTRESSGCYLDHMSLRLGFYGDYCFNRNLVSNCRN